MKFELMTTFTGLHFDPFNPRIEDIQIEDIAHALSLICRYGGHCRDFYSVAEHSLRCSYVGTEHLLEKLLHDATEAYLGDLIRPFKVSELGKLHKEKEHQLELVIVQRFGLQWPLPASVKLADNILLHTEKRDIITANQHAWFGDGEFEPLPEKIIPMSWQEAKRRFLLRFDELMRSRDPRSHTAHNGAHNG